MPKLILLKLLIMNKLLKKFIAVAVIVLSSNVIAAETLDVAGLYIGERHNNPNGAQKFIDRYNTGEGGKKCIFGILCAGSKQMAFHVVQNTKGLHIWVIYKDARFTGMVLNSDGTFTGKFNKNTIKGYFDDDLFYAEFTWKGAADPFYLVGLLSIHDKLQKEEVKKYIKLAEKATELQKRVEELDEEIVLINEACIADLEALDIKWSIKYNDLEIAKNLEIDELNKKKKDLERQLKEQPKINIRNLILADSVKKGAILWSGPSKDTSKLMDLSEGSNIVELRRVKNDDAWTLVANERGRLGYVETKYIISQTTINTGGEQPVKLVPTDREIEIYEPTGVVENEIVSVNAKGLTVIKGKFDNKKIENVKSVTVNKSEATFKGNLFMKTVSIKSGLNKINIKILTSSGDQYDYNFVIKAPD